MKSLKFLLLALSTAIALATTANGGGNIDLLGPVGEAARIDDMNQCKQTILSLGDLLATAKQLRDITLKNAQAGGADPSAWATANAANAMVAELQAWEKQLMQRTYEDYMTLVEKGIKPPFTPFGFPQWNDDSDREAAQEAVRHVRESSAEAARQAGSDAARDHCPPRGGCH